MDITHKKVEYKFFLVEEHTKDNKYKIELENLHNEYLMFYTNALIMNKREEDVIQLIISEGILDRLDNYANEVIDDAYMLKEYMDILIPLKVNSNSPKLCMLCNSEMHLSYSKLYYECYDCCLTEHINTCHKECALPRSRIGNFNPERHFKTWIDRILAREPEEEICTSDDPTGEKLIQLIKKHLIAKCKSIEHLTIDDIRNVLKETNKTHYNRNTSLIAKKITGRSPPKLDECRYNTIYALFFKSNGRKRSDS